MKFTPKTISSMILVISSMICTRTIFAFIDDPEGPNLLVVLVMTAIIYAVSTVISMFMQLTKSTSDGLRRILPTVFIQIVLSVTFYFLLR